MNQEKHPSELAKEAFRKAKGGNINFWSMPEDDPEAIYWMKVWDMGYDFAQESKWISVKDRLPDPRTRVSVWRNDGAFGAYQTQGEYILSDNFGNIFTGNGGPTYNITHWMPLLEPPKE